MAKASSKKPKVKQLTYEQRKKLLLTPCKSRAEVKNWIKFFFGARSSRPDCF